MDDQSAFELVHAINQLATKLDTGNARQDESNDLMRSLIDALNTNSQELLEVRKYLVSKKS